MQRTTFNAWAVALIAALTMTVNGYDSSTFNSVQGFQTFVDHFKEPGQTKIDPNIIGAVGTAYTVGGIVSGIFINPTLSRLTGRRIPMQLGCLLVNISTFIMVFAPNMSAFMGGRVIMGIGQGIAIPSGPTYIAEVAPSNVRGTMMSFWQVGYTIGAAVVYWAAYGASKAPHLGLWQYRVPIMMQLFFPTIVLVGMFWCPETPRWLVERGKIEQARKSLEFTRHPDEVEAELESIMLAIEYEKCVVDPNQRWWTPYITLFKESSLRRRIIVAILINVGQQVCGNGMLASYSTIIYQRTFSSSDTIFLLNGLYGSFAILFTLNCTWLVERMGRRWILLVGAAGQGIMLLIVSIIGSVTKENADGTRPYNVGIGVAACFFMFAIFYKPSWGATVWIYSSEIFSTDVRAHAVAISAQTQNVVSTILNQFFPLFLAKCGFYTFYFFAGLNIFLFAFVWFFVPETKGVALEDIDKLFGGVSRREGGEEIEHQHKLDLTGIKEDVAHTEVVDVEKHAHIRH